MADIHGLSFQFYNADGTGWFNPANPVVTVPFQVVRRTNLRTGPVVQNNQGSPEAPGQVSPGIFNNVSTAHAQSVAVFPGPDPYLLADAQANARYLYLALTAAITVDKSPTGDVPPGQVIPFTLTFTNAGEAPFMDPIFSDRLPLDPVTGNPQLIFDPDADPTVPQWSFALTGPPLSPPSGTPLPTSPSQMDVQIVNDVIYFYPPAGTAFEPGQVYTITIRLMLAPGLAAGDNVTNTAAIDLGSIPVIDCAPTWDFDTNECIDTTVVRPIEAPALSTIKYVKADVPPSAAGLTGVPDVFSTANAYDCTGQDIAGFYRIPCIPVSVPGTAETWRFDVTNVGTVPLDKLVTIDNLPTPGDQGLIVVVPRLSAWEPTFNGVFSLTGLPAGATVSAYTSPSSVPCTSDLNPLGIQCPAGAWTPLTASTDLTTVRSLQFAIDFAPGALFDPGQVLTIEFDTLTTPARLDALGYPIAWNTVSTGGEAAMSSGTAVVVPATEGRRVGVSYPTGPILLEKRVTGPNAALAPTHFPVQLECTVGGVPMTGLPQVTLRAGAPPVRLDGLPIGAVCTASEQQWGQTQTIIGTVTVGGPNDPIALLRAENVYDVADLTVSKLLDTTAVDADGKPVIYGPFTFDIVCYFWGSEVWATGYDATNPMTAQLWQGNSWALAGLPPGAVCTVTETDNLGALNTQMMVTDSSGKQPPVPGNQASVVIDGVVTVDVAAVNSFGTGSLVLRKNVSGPAAALFATGPFVFGVKCTLDTGNGPISVWDGTVTLRGPNQLVHTIRNIAGGATCTVREIDDGGATTTVVSPTTVTVGDGLTVTVDIDNTFEAGSLTVRKVVDGPGATLWGAGPFEVTLECRIAGGQPVAIPGGPTRQLSADNDWTASYSPLLHGLRCTLTETGTGGAGSSNVANTAGEPVRQFTISQGQELELVVTNIFELGAISVNKTVSGIGASGAQGMTFTVELACEWQGSTIAIPGGGERQLTVSAPVHYQDLPVGAQCTITETATGGASSHTVSYADQPQAQTIEIVGGATGAVTVNNDYNMLTLPLTGPVSGAALLLAVTLLLAGAGVWLFHLRLRRPEPRHLAAR